MKSEFKFDKYTDAMNHSLNRVTHIESKRFLTYLPGMTDEQAISLLRKSL